MKKNWFPLVLVIIIAFVLINKVINGLEAKKEEENKIAALLNSEPIDTVWRGWNKYQIPIDSDSGKLIWYGYELISNTAYYLGPKGIIAQTTNGMNCQNCHLAGGTVPYGNNFGKVYATYPQFRARNNGMQTIYDRVNDCFERSLNGKSMDSSTLEMHAIYAYMKWLGKGIPKGVKRGGTSLMKLKYLDRAASPEQGMKVYMANCQSCHGHNGEGQPNIEGTGYTYPPLWGKHSYNDGAGLYRISSFASFVKNNMPFGTDYHHPKLTNEEAWDVAAFVNSQSRPHKDQSMDWKNINKKPIDFPFGPYSDTFSEKQHKFGPFQPIKAARLTAATQ
ncbi:MAG: c-type cytochrome [Sphingobacteriales bacterium]|uniref:c-type cytochrome n=1 Tax=Hydrotalea flava TaxID=714549 RepID=UPI000B0A61C1|nr:c-type cytochrome [Hydrotalea flava]RTL49309.1 MAG: c-type cytochrome [Sphingobacteriales bacterium]